MWKKTYQKHRRLVISAAAGLIVVLLGLVGTTAGFVKARNAQDLARASETLALEAAGRATSAEKVAVAEKADAVKQRNRAATAQGIAEARRHAATIAFQQAEQDHYRAEWLLYSITFSRNGQFLAAQVNNGDLMVWGVGTGDNVASIDTQLGRSIDVAITPDGATVATCSGEDSEIRLWEPAHSRYV